MLNISYAGCLGLYPVMPAQFTLKVVWRPEIVKKFTKTPIVRVQGCSRSSMLAGYPTTPELVSNACYDTQQVCANNIIS